MDCAEARASCLPERGGVQLVAAERGEAVRAREAVAALADRLGLAAALRVGMVPAPGRWVVCAALADEPQQAWVPGHDSTHLHEHLGHARQSDLDDDIDRETLAAMLAGPRAFAFPDAPALASALRVRRHIARAARRTALAFKTEAAERPAHLWRYDEDRGFLLQPGADLIDALVGATQPEATGRLYDFSCYRATEYVILLGLARELRDHHPALYEALQHHGRHEAIRSGRFHEVFLVEPGVDAPLPPAYYVPGDRVWFRNPDEISSDASGYEGSWVVYMGGGLFGNFWRRDDPFTLKSKCVEIHHWRHATFTDDQGVRRIDERLVFERCQATHADPEAERAILARMMRPRDPQGVYAEGGCIDTTREYPRGVAGQGCELRLPPLPG